MRLNRVVLKRTSGRKRLPPSQKASRTFFSLKSPDILPPFRHCLTKISAFFSSPSKQSLSHLLHSIFPANTQKRKGGVFWKRSSTRDEVISTRDDVRAQPCDSTELILRKGLINNIGTLNKSIVLLTKHSGCRMLLFLIQLAPNVQSNLCLSESSESVSALCLPTTIRAPSQRDGL